MQEKTKWTILTYIAAHNNLDKLGERSLDQIIRVGSTPQVMHGVLFDGTKGAVKYILGGPGKVIQQEQLGNFDCGDPEALVKTAELVFKKYPAEKYALVLWSHGTGWQPDVILDLARQVRGDHEVNKYEAKKRSSPTSMSTLFRTTLAEILKKSYEQRAICFDDGSKHSIDTLELEKVVNAITSKTRSQLELIGMDACLMGSLEVAYQLKENTHYMVASEELVPGNSWPYNEIYERLKKNPSMSGGDLAKIIINAYLAYYQAYPPQFGKGDVTKIALDLSELDDLVATIDSLSKELINAICSEAPSLWKAQIITRDQEKHHRPVSKFDLHLWDIRSLACELAENTSNEKVKTLCNSIKNLLKPGGAILEEVHLGEWFDKIGGLSIYLPMPNEAPRVTKYYPELQFGKNTSWYDMLVKYRQAGKKSRRLNYLT